MFDNIFDLDKFTLNSDENYLNPDEIQNNYYGYFDNIDKFSNINEKFHDHYINVLTVINPINSKYF